MPENNDREVKLCIGLLCGLVLILLLRNGALAIENEMQRIAMNAVAARNRRMNDRLRAYADVEGEDAVA